MRVTRDRGVDPGHIEGAVNAYRPTFTPWQSGGLRQDSFTRKICAPTRIAGIFAFLEALAGTPNRRL
jgi:hypothetical protein